MAYIVKDPTPSSGPNGVCDLEIVDVSLVKPGSVAPTLAPMEGHSGFVGFSLYAPQGAPVPDHVECPAAKSGESPTRSLREYRNGTSGARLGCSCWSLAAALTSASVVVASSGHHALRSDGRSWARRDINRDANERQLRVDMVANGDRRQTAAA